MVQGLFKSFFLHFTIIFLFIYGAEFFKKNKRFEIIEIPLDIVDISDQTVNKTENQKQKKNKNKQITKNKSGFQPPKVQSKPKPPEFKDKTDKIKKTQKKEKDKTEKQQQKKRVDNILKSIEKIKSSQKNEKKPKEVLKDKNETQVNESKNIKLGEKLTISEKDAIRRQFYQCWIVPAGAKDIREYKVSILLRLNKDGEVINSRIMNKSNMNNTFFRTLAESAIRAVNHPDCKKLKVPAKKYDTWKETILDFDPSVMIN